MVEEPVVDSNSTLEGAESNMDTNIDFLDTEAPIDVVEEVRKFGTLNSLHENCFNLKLTDAYCI